MTDLRCERHTDEPAMWCPDCETRTNDRDRRITVAQRGVQACRAALRESNERAEREGR